MKKFLSLIFIVLILGATGCAKKDNPGVAYRDFLFTRSHGADLPFITETDIPNNYVCTQIEFKISDEEGHGLTFYDFGLKNGESTKKFVIDPDAPVGLSDTPQNGTAEDIFEISSSYFCASGELVLNNILKKNYSSFGIEDITQH